MPLPARRHVPLDIVLNPLGVPSRMNIGQVLEVQPGLRRGQPCGIKVMTPVFDSAREADIGDTFDTAREMWHGENAPAYPTKLPKIMGEKGHIIDFSKIELDRDGKTVPCTTAVPARSLRQPRHRRLYVLPQAPPPGRR